MRITDLLSNKGYILFNKQLAKEFGLAEAILLGELAQEHNYWEDNNLLEDGWFYSTVENIEESTTLTGRQQRPALKHLEEEGLIMMANRGIPCKRYFKLDVTKLHNKLLQNVTTGCDKMSQQDATKCHTNNNKNNNKDSNKNYIYSRVIDCLNEKAGTKYKSNTNTTKSYINARLNEGFTEDDFIAVIDKKCREWVGTSMEQYLRPQTLFSTKFESYLNQKEGSHDTRGRVGAMSKEEEGTYRAGEWSTADDVDWFTD